MLLWFVIGYWAISVLIGLIVALRVRNTADYAAAGHRMPMYVVTATVFATWFGSETVLGIPATFLKEGLHGVVADPFGSSLCLVLVGLFFARPLYRRKLLTIGDFYRRQYGRSVEILVTLCIVISYLGWVAAQIKALGLVFNVVSDGAMSKAVGMWVGATTVMVYTLFGGMLSVAITDFIQMIIIMLGMIYIGWDLSGPAGGVVAVVHQAAQQGKLSFWPSLHWERCSPFYSLDHHDVGLYSTTGCFSACHLVGYGGDGTQCLRIGRSTVFSVRFYPHFSGLFRDTHRSGTGGSLPGFRFTVDTAATDSASCAAICPDHVFRCAVIRHQKLCISNTAGTIGDFCRKYRAGFLPDHDGSTVIDGHALGGFFVYAIGYGNRAEFTGFDFQYGGKCIPGDAGGSIRSIGLWCLLEACHPVGWLGFGAAWHRGLAVGRIFDSRCVSSPTIGWLDGEPSGYGRRFLAGMSLQGCTDAAIRPIKKG